MISQLTARLKGANRPIRQRAVLGFEPLEGREVPAGIFVAGVGGVTQAADPEVSIYATTGPQANQRLGIQLEAFGGTAGDTRIAFGDVNADGTDDIIAAAGKGGGSEVAIFDGKSALTSARVEIARFFVYSNAPAVTTTTRGFDGGVFVAAADLNGDGFAELITTPGAGGRGHLKVLDFNTANGSPRAPLGTGAFAGSNPTLRASAYTFTDYNGEIRVATLRAQNEQFVVTSSGAGVPGDVRAYSGVYGLGQIPDLTPVPASFLEARLVPFGGYTGGLSVAAGDTDGDGDDELFVSKNDGAPSIEVYDATDVVAAFAGGNVSPAPMSVITNVFPGFNGEIRLGAADVDGNGRVEVLATTGFSGDPQGTPVKVLTRAIGGTAFTETAAFYSNPGYQPGAWLGGKDLTYSTDLTNPGVSGSDATLPATFSFTAGNPDAFIDGTDVGLRFPAAGNVPTETVTGAGLAFKNLEVSFSLTHALTRETTVTLRAGVAGSPSLKLFDGPNARVEAFNGLQVTITDFAATTIPAGTAGSPVVGRFQADGGSIGAFVRSLTNKNVPLFVIFEDSVNLDDGTVTTNVAPTIRLLY